MSRSSVYFWRSPSGEWSFSGRGAGLHPMRLLVGEYTALAEKLAASQDGALSPESLYRLLEAATPLHRAARNFFETLVQGKQLLDDHDLHEELQELCDQMAAVARTADLVMTDAKHAIDFYIARESRIQSITNRHRPCPPID